MAVERIMSMVDVIVVANIVTFMYRYFFMLLLFMYYVMYS